MLTYFPEDVYIFIIIILFWQHSAGKKLSTAVPNVYLLMYAILYAHNEEKEGLAIPKVM